MDEPTDRVIAWPTLWVALDWIPQHCVIPDRDVAGLPFIPYTDQLWVFANHYRVKPRARLGQLATAFHYRRSLEVGPQKKGKGPRIAAQICLEAVGPALFGGWSEGSEVYDCRDYGCGCGWVYEYEPGEAMGQPWATPLVQVTASSEEQTDNIYDALRPMIDLGPLTEQIPKTGEEFIRLPNDGRIDVVTSAARSRLGQRVTFVAQDETGTWTVSNKLVELAEHQRRNLAGMGGRAVETTNAWDPTQQSVAQRTFEALAKDVFRYYVEPPKGLSFKNKTDRRKILRLVYGDSLTENGGHVDLDGIEAEALEIMEKDPAQAERFFGNRRVYGLGSWLPEGLWEGAWAGALA